MSIDAERFDRALPHRNAARTKRPAERAPVTTPLATCAVGSDTQAFFDEVGLPPPLRRFLEVHSYGSTVGFGRLTFGPVCELAAENLDEMNARCIASGLLIVGSGLNGDPIVVDLQNDLRVGFVYHDELWESDGDDDAPSVREILVPTPLDLGTFYCAATFLEDRFPVDAYAAAQCSELDSWKVFAHP